MLSKSSSPILISKSLVLALVTGCLGMAAWLVPDKVQLADRMQKDDAAGRTPSANTVLNKEGKVIKLSPLQLLQQATLQEDVYGAEAAILAAQDAPACHRIIEASPLPPAQKTKLYSAVGRSALATGDPHLAASLYQRMLLQAPSDELLSGAVQSFRYCGKGAAALAIVETWLQSKRPLPPALRDIEITLARETNAPRRALTLLLDRLTQEKTSGKGVQETTLALALEVAGNAGDIKPVLPIVEAHLATAPSGQLTWTQIAQAKPAPTAAWRKLTLLLAKNAEWGGEPDRAMDHYLKLAVLKDKTALDRVKALHPGLNRQSDWMRLLGHVIPIPGQPHLEHELAYLQGTAGLYPEAQQTYTSWLKKHPNDIKALVELAALHVEQGQAEPARQLVQKAAQLAPQDLDIGKELAHLNLITGDHKKAFNFYSALNETQHDPLTLENYALLAEALGDYDAYHRAIVSRLNLLKDPRPADYLEAARTFNLKGNIEGTVEILATGLRRLPASKILRMELGGALKNSDRLAEAISLLGYNSLKNDMRAMSLFIECCAMDEQYQAALTFLGLGFEKRFSFPPDTRLDLGHIYFENGYISEAEELYASVPEEPGVMSLLADAHFRRSDFVSAERCLRKAIAQERTSPPKTYIFLGDILKALGRVNESDAAYSRAMELMQNKVASVAPPVQQEPSVRVQ